MVNRTFRYPFGNWLSRALLWLFFSVLIFTLLFDVPGALSNMLDGTAAQWDFGRVALAVVLGFIFWAYTTNAYPNIQETDEGLKVEFFWKSLFVPWGNIVLIKEGGRGGGKNWTVEVNGLTVLHRLYGLFFLWRFVPAFVIYTYMADHQKLVKDITKRMGTPE